MSASEPAHDPIDPLEKRLAGLLRPVRPSGDVARRLRDRIRLPEPGVVIRRVTDWQFWMVVLGGVVTFGVLILTVARALFHFFQKRS